MAFKHYALVFKHDGLAIGVPELARTIGEAITKALDRTDYELENLLSVREVLSAPETDKFFPN
jgi:hypothetical protein